MILLIDALVICLASGAVLVASRELCGALNHWLAAAFPLVTLAILHGRRHPMSVVGARPERSEFV